MAKARGAYGGDIEREPRSIRRPDAYLRTIHVGRRAGGPVARGPQPNMEDLIVLLTGQAARMPTAALAVIAVGRVRLEPGALRRNGQLVNGWRPSELA
ncbi:MAG: hypothetical protein R2854_12155 [Caldilineaceae bacterium]